MHQKNKKQYDALVALANELNVDFETEGKSPYNPEFVAKILAGEKAKNDGERGLRVDVENLWK